MPIGAMPSESGQDLLYVSSANGNVYVYTYPQRRAVGTLTGFIQPVGECVDPAGDVFITAYSNYSFNASTIYEYAHGGTSPIATLNDPGVAFGCAVDPKTGNLAVANVSDYANPYNPGYGDVAIYSAAQGNPTMYYSAEFEDFWFCGYDDKGNLYLSAFPSNHASEAQLVRLASGSSSLELIKLDWGLYGGNGFEPSIQWDGTYVTVTSDRNSQRHGHGLLFVYRLRISKRRATIISSTAFRSNPNVHGGQSWIQGGRIIGIYYDKGFGNVAFWPYQGGKPEHKIRNIAEGALWGVTVSVAPSGSHVRR